MSIAHKLEKKWGEEEDEVLKAAVAEYTNGAKINWQKISECLPGRSNKSCRKRWIHSLDPNLRKGRWSASEDSILLDAVAKHGQNWSKVARHVDGRTDDQCAKRWRENLDPAISREPWTSEEDKILVEALKQHGQKWNTISALLPGRASVHCRNRFSHLKRARASTSGQQLMSNHDSPGSSATSPVADTPPAVPATIGRGESSSGNNMQLVSPHEPDLEDFPWSSSFLCPNKGIDPPTVPPIHHHHHHHPHTHPQQQHNSIPALHPSQILSSSPSATHDPNESYASTSASASNDPGGGSFPMECNDPTCFRFVMPDSHQDHLHHQPHASSSSSSSSSTTQTRPPDFGPYSDMREHHGSGRTDQFDHTHLSNRFLQSFFQYPDSMNQDARWYPQSAGDKVISFSSESLGNQNAPSEMASLQDPSFPTFHSRQHPPAPPPHSGDSLSDFSRMFGQGILPPMGSTVDAIHDPSLFVSGPGQFDQSRRRQLSPGGGVTGRSSTGTPMSVEMGFPSPPSSTPTWVSQYGATRDGRSPGQVQRSLASGSNPHSPIYDGGRYDPSTIFWPPHPSQTHPPPSSPYTTTAASNHYRQPEVIQIPSHPEIIQLKMEETDSPNLSTPSSTPPISATGSGVGVGSAFDVAGSAFDGMSVGGGTGGYRQDGWMGYHDWDAIKTETARAS